MQKCNGIKITELENKKVLTGQEYIVLAEKEANFKLPIEAVTDVILNNSKFKASVKDVYQSSTPVAKVSLANSEFAFEFGIPAGRPGRDGIDGAPGTGGDTIRTIIAYKSTKTTTRPSTPVGGSWDYATNVVIYPEGWSGSDMNSNGYVWISTSAFSSNGQQVQPWTLPVRITAEDGRDGSDGVNIEFIYKLTLSDLIVPSKPGGNTQDSAITQGWTDHPSGISQEKKCEWICSHYLEESGQWSTWSEPAIWSRWGEAGKDGDGVEYIFQRTKTGMPPKNITDNNPDRDEYIPASAPGEEPWTDDPTGVNATFKYEWVSQRKYDGNTHKWGNFSSPALWSKYGDDGEDGYKLRIMYTKTESSETKPVDPDRLNINPGSIWSVAMPKYTGKQAIWGIQALVAWNNTLVIDTTLPEAERGWQGPYLITGVPGLDGNNFNFKVDVFKKSATMPDPPTGNDPYNPGNGWVEIPDTTNGVWWKCTALVDGPTGMVIEWGAVICITGQGIVVKGELSSVDQLPTTGNVVGDAYIINGYLWVWNGSAWVNVGQAKGPAGDYVEFRFARNNSWSTPPSLQVTNRYPTGWTTFTPNESSGSVLWMTNATVNGTDNTLKTNWSTPVYVTGAAGKDGVSGIPGVSYELRYCAGTATEYLATWNSTVRTTRNPSSYGWNIDLPTVDNTNKYIWFIQSRIAYNSNSDRVGYLEDGYWSAPHLLSGVNGLEPGGSNPIIYPAGVYATDVLYINDNVTAPYVWDSNGNAFYLLNTPMKWKGTEQGNKYPSTDTSSAWVKFEMFDAIFAAVGVFGNALVGESVFNNKWMFSQGGKNPSNVFTSHYENFNAVDPMNKTNSFRPNYCVNFKTGDGWFGAGSSHFAQDGSGYVADGNIKWDASGALTMETGFEKVHALESYTSINLPTVPVGYSKSIIVRTPAYTKSYMGHTISGNFGHLDFFRLPKVYNELSPSTTYSPGNTITFPSSSTLIFSCTRMTSDIPNWTLTEINRIDPIL